VPAASNAPASSKASASRRTSAADTPTPPAARP
jgi:hypothetical protein